MRLTLDYRGEDFQAWDLCRLCFASEGSRKLRRRKPCRTSLCRRQSALCLWERSRVPHPGKPPSTCTSTFDPWRFWKASPRNHSQLRPWSSSPTLCAVAAAFPRFAPFSFAWGQTIDCCRRQFALIRLYRSHPHRAWQAGEGPEVATPWIPRSACKRRSECCEIVAYCNKL